MQSLLRLLTLTTLLFATPSLATATNTTSSSLAPEVVGYLLLDSTTGPTKLAALAAAAPSLPLTRLVLSFARPDLVYSPSSFTLANVGLGLFNASVQDLGFAALKAAVATLQAGGVEVFLSVGGWNYNCFSYLYMVSKYSIAYFSTGPNVWKISQYGNGTASGCTVANQFCYVCEPPSEGTTLSAFTIFPEPAQSPTWKLAQTFVESSAGGATPVWHPQLIGGNTYNDSGVQVTVPGSNLWNQLNRDPYQDLIYLVKDLGVDGVDLDYEEMWHGEFLNAPDTFRSGTGLGPFKLDQTVYKYTAIAQDLIINIQAIYPTCKLSVAAGAAGAWNSNWWGGNLKGLWYYSNLWYPSVNKFITSGPNAGGIGVMTYDLSDSQTFHECPTTQSACSLSDQVAFYLQTYLSAGITSPRVGFEVGTPAYPDPIHDPTDQLPLTQAALTQILPVLANASVGGAIVWEVYKGEGVADVNATEVLQA
ncbi:hypothetical protein HDU98_001724, partial [Podochytrium sp. JEL0797]